MDHIYLLWLQQFREATGGFFDSFFTDVTKLGERFFVLIVLSGIFWCIHKKAGRALLLGFTAAYWANTLIKIAACVYRPFMTDTRLHPLIKQNGYSFPSGHATCATVCFGGIALWQWHSKALRNTLLILILLVMFSRNFIGVHTPQDVLAGCAITFVLMWSAVKLTDYEETHPGADRWILLVGIILSAALAWFAATKNYPLETNAAGKLLVKPESCVKAAFRMSGWGLGFFIGWFIEKRWIRFSVEGTWQQRCTRFIWGILGLWLVMGGLAPFAESIVPTIGRIMGNLLVVLYITCGFPLLIKLTEKQKR